MNEGVFACLHDSKRTKFFRKAIRNSIKKGDVVLELGAGTGILSMFAIDAGASKVYAVELDKGNVKTLKKVVKENGYKNKIIVMHADATNVKVPEKVDLVICEMIATGLIEELQIPANNNAMRFLKKNGKVLLSEYHIYIDLVSSKSNFYNKKFNIMRFELPEMRDMRSETFSTKHLVKKIDLTKKNESSKLNKSLAIIAEKTGTINAIRLSGETFFSDGSTFTNSTAYDFPIILPTEEISVKKGDTLSLSITYELCKGPSKLEYKISKKTRSN